jgi:hypothetical protein
VTPSRSLIVFGVITIAFGGIWLLAQLHMLPDINWLWTGFLAGCGALCFAAGGISRASVVMGLWFFAAAVTSVMRRMGGLSFEVEVPVLVIVFGFLLLLAAVMPPDRPRVTVTTNTNVLPPVI